MVSILPLIFYSSSFLFKPQEIVPRTPTIINITFTLVFHSLFSSPERPVIIIIIIIIIIGHVDRVFANGAEDRGSIPGWVIPNTQKMLLDTSLLKSMQYKVGIKSKVE